MGELKVSGLSKVYADGTRALDDVSLVAHSGRVLTLLGPSGCGKSTLLRIVAGLDQPSSGSLVLDGESYRRRQKPGLDVGTTAPRTRRRRRA